MRYENSDEPIVAMKVRPRTYRTCAAGYRRRLYEDKTRPSKGVLDLERVEVNSTITSIGFKGKKNQKSKHRQNGNKTLSGKCM
jgi:hypothetical protein